jgi:S-adenosylmethionine:tRNA ribosyltransferase-isomerase
MKLSEFDYNLPSQLIAQKPAIPRDSARLIVLERKTGKIYHSHFPKIDKFLAKGDVIVLNNTKVFPARLVGYKIPSGGKIELLLLQPNLKNLKKIVWSNQWLAIFKGKLKVGQKIKFAKILEGEIIKEIGREKIIEFNKKGESFKKLIFNLGKVPIPPYIKSKIPKPKLKKYYQTVFAEKIGSVAAPTAGFHFTKRLIKKLQKKGVTFKYITLHVGLGTFQPIKGEIVEKYKMPQEWAEISKKTAKFLNRAKKEGKRIIACGTTVTRTLEGFFSGKKLSSGEKFVDLFIYPGYKFKFIDGLITNFHLPKSTPLLLACAFAGKNFIFKAYKEAIEKKYRFFSFGDAMLIL